MPIETTIDGVPGAIRDTATWLRSSLAAGVSSYADLVYSARRDAGSDWDGDASEAFQAAMTRLGKRGDELDVATRSVARELDEYAGALQSAQDHMQSAREIATAGGLTLTSSQILEPGPAPSVPPRPASDGTATPAQVNTYNTAVTASDTQVVAATAYAAAEIEAADGDRILKQALDALEKAKNKDLPFTQWGLYAAGAAGTFGEDVMKRGLSAMRGQAGFLTRQSARYNELYLTSPGGSAEALSHEASRVRSLNEAQRYLGKADELEFGKLGRAFGGKLPIVGAAVTVAALGHDIHEGKDPSTAIVGAGAGALATAGTVMAVSAVGGPVGVAVGAGVVVGIFVGMGAEWAWENAVSDDVKQKVDDGIQSVIDGASDGASSAWNAAFG